jgi:hypothetical protein
MVVYAYGTVIIQTAKIRILFINATKAMTFMKLVVWYWLIKKARKNFSLAHFRYDYALTFIS